MKPAFRSGVSKTIVKELERTHAELGNRKKGKKMLEIHENMTYEEKMKFWKEASRIWKKLYFQCVAEKTKHDKR